MSSRLSGRLVTEANSSNIRKSLVGFIVTLVGTNDPDPVSTVTDLDGNFQLSYRKGILRGLELVVEDIAGRVLPFADEPVAGGGGGRVTIQDGRALLVDAEEGPLTFHNFVIREADASGLAVTLGTGEARRVSRGNAVTVLVDNAVFAHAAERIGAAQESILLTQLTFTLPEAFHPNATQETTKVVFQFRELAPDAEHPRAAGVGDLRPERLLLQAADNNANIDIRILLNAYKIPFFVKLVAGALLLPAGTDGIFAVAGGLFDDTLTDADEAKRYFGAADRANIKILGFQQPLVGFGAMHARLAVFDHRHAICMGASFTQSYVDTHDHAIDAPVRGSSESLPDHDVGIGVTGPAVADLHEAIKLLWDTEAPNDPVPNLRRVAPPQESGGDGVCSMQIVRTLSSGKFDPPSKGEKGILEAYLRAIAKAETFIYLENQYFINERIGEALVRVMNKRPSVQVIVVLNIKPDQRCYPFKQRRLITRIRRDIGQSENGPLRFGVFTRWTHEIGSPRPRIMPVYIHSKVGIVDDKWATVGSANLDGLSLDAYSLCSFTDFFLSLIGPSEKRAIEVNALLFEDADGAQSNSVVDTLRRKLWAEHLGFSLARDVPDPAAAELNFTNIPTGGWLELWDNRAKATLQHLIDRPSMPSTGMARVLPWPLDNCTHKTPRDYLTALKVRSHAVVPLKSTRAFNFETGEWRPGSKAKMDY